MEKRLQALYKDGVLQPLEPLLLDDEQKVTLTITDAGHSTRDLGGYFSAEEWAQAMCDEVSLDEVRRALSTISGSLSEAVLSVRQER